MTESMLTAFSTAVDGIKSDVIKMIGVAMPAALGISGIIIAVKLGVTFFKSVAS